MRKKIKEHNLGKGIYRTLRAFGIDLREMKGAIKSLCFYKKDLRNIKKDLRNNKDWKIFLKFPCLKDKFASAGIASGHYFHQDLLVAQKIYKNNPKIHVDIGSSVYGFVSHIASFRKIEVFDIRQLKSQHKNIIFCQRDFMNPNEDYLNYTDSLSCLHALEHFGLGRYNDRIDINGHKKGLKNMVKMLKNGGVLYLSVPIGKQRIEFNAHRVFSIKYLLRLFSENNLNITSFSYVDDIGNLHKDVKLNEKNIKDNCNCYFGCGIFELKNDNL